MSQKKYLRAILIHHHFKLFSMLKSVLQRLNPYNLSKSNWGLEYGGILFASKFQVNNLFKNEKEMLKFTKIPINKPYRSRIKIAEEFMKNNKLEFPIVLKPDSGGRIGKGVILANNKEELKQIVKNVTINYLIQEFCDYKNEYGLFYYRLKGKDHILSINLTIQPTIIGNGKSSIRELIEKDQLLKRFKRQYNLKLLNKIPRKGEKVILSHIGNHAQGGSFIDVTDLKTQTLLKTVGRFAKNKGFNFGRIDLKAKSNKDLKEGKFKVIEVNGTDAMSTIYHDPKYSLLDIFRILNKQYKTLLKVAKENKSKKMDMPGFVEFYKKLQKSERDLEINHQICIKIKQER